MTDAQQPQRDFDAEFADSLSQPGFTFKLGGHTFHTKPVPPPKAFLVKERGFMAAHDFLLAMLTPEDREVYEKMVEDPNANLSAFQIDEIASWLIEVTSERPTEAPASSGSGGAATS